MLASLLLWQFRGVKFFFVLKKKEEKKRFCFWFSCQVSSKVSKQHLRPISVSAREARLTHTGVQYVATIGINEHCGKVTLNMQLSGKQRERVDVRVIDIVSNCGLLIISSCCVLVFIISMFLQQHLALIKAHLCSL